MYSDRPVVLTEFPKSGGSWVASLIGDALNIPVRDIYVRPGFKLFEIDKHPWYDNGQALDFPAECVIKSHEPPGSELIEFAAKYIHLIRDGRDVAVSKWFFDKDFCVKNGIVPSFEEDFDSYIARTAREWSEYVAAWSGLPVLTVRYEDFLRSPVASLRSVLAEIADVHFSDARLMETVSRFSKENFGAMLGKVFSYNTFVRRGESGDWRNHFSIKNVQDFKVNGGEALLALRYELTADWGL